MNPRTIHIHSQNLSLPLIAVVLALGCLEGAPATLPEYADPPEPATVPDDLGESPRMLDLAQQVPGFGGFYYEGVGRVVIAMAESNAGGFPAARQAMSAELKTADNTTLEVIEQVVEFSFIDLARQRARLRAKLFDIPGVETLAVDQVSNRIRIGLSDPSARMAVLELATDLDAPVEMLAFSEAGLAKYLIGSVDEAPRPIQTQRPTLQDYTRDLPGGYQVSIMRQGQATCTAGFVAYPAADSMIWPPRDGFVSASHCSGIKFAKDTFRWGQPTLITS